MKIDEKDKNRSFSKRLLEDLTEGLIKILKEKSLESITVGELCRVTNYPRSTFYNYFEDVYALTDYLWEVIGNNIGIFNYNSIDHKERTATLFNYVYDYFLKNRETIDLLLVHNKIDGAMIDSLNKYVKNIIYKMIMDCPYSVKYPVPYEIMAKHYSNTLEMILLRCFVDKNIKKEEALSYLDFLIGTLERVGE